MKLVHARHEYMLTEGCKPLGVSASLAGMACESAGLRIGAVGIVYAHMGREAVGGDGNQVDISVRAGFARVFSAQAVMKIAARRKPSGIT